MPYLQVTSNIALTDAEKSNALQTLSKTVSELLGKSEDYVMTSWSSVKMTMAASDAPAALICLQSIRLPDDKIGELSKELTERFGLIAECRSERIYISFENVAPTHWAWNGKPFGG